MAKTLGSLAIGDTLEIPVMEPYRNRFGDSIVFLVVDINHEGYPKNSVTLLTKQIIQFLAFDAQEPSSTITGIKNKGNADYIRSNLRQWLNSDAKAGGWFQQLEGDQIPVKPYVYYNAYADWDGFLRMLPPGFVKKLLNTTIIATVATKTSEISDRFFLLGGAEVRGSNYTDGVPLAYFDGTPANRQAHSTQSAYNVSEVKVNSPVEWWLRYSPSVESVRVVNGNGLMSTSVYAASPWAAQNGLRPACNLPNDLAVSPEPNSNGNYELTIDLSGKESISASYQTPVHVTYPLHEATVKAVRYAAKGAVFKVEVTNNPFDENPIWEDCTQSVLDGTAYEFKNRINVSGQCGFNVRVSIDKGTATETCWLSGVEGRFT